jgi:hypothetical protein
VCVWKKTIHLYRDGATFPPEGPVCVWKKTIHLYRDGILGHQFDKRLESYTSMLFTVFLMADF